MPPERRSDPKSRQRDGKGKHRGGPNLVLCRCKQVCLTLNQDTGRYEGDGEWVTPITQARHRRDERLHRLLRTTLSSKPEGGSMDAGTGWFDFIEVELDVLSNLPATNPNLPLVFENDPLDSGPFSITWGSHQDVAIRLPNQGLHALKPDAGANADILRIENTIWEIHRTLEGLKENDEEKCAELQDKALDCLQGLDREKELHWAARRGRGISRPSNSVEIINSGMWRLVFVRRAGIDLLLERYFNPTKQMADTIKAASLVCLVLQDFYFTSRRALQTHLAGLRDLLASAGTDPLTLKQLPKDPRSLAPKFLLEPVTKTFVVCPTCHHLFYYHGSLRSQKNRVNETCLSRRTPGSDPCNTPLWEKVYRGPAGYVDFPRRKFVHQPLKSWIGRLLSRPGIEDVLEARPTRSEIDPEVEIDDIWLSTVFTNLKDRSNQRYYPGPPGELRLIFSLSVDSFSPFGNKAGKQTSGSTGIWMVLLNLPRHLRYRHENIYLAGVIPGPSKPPSDRINPYIQLTVDELKDLWHPGAFYSRTFKYPKGRLVRGMVIPLVCDLLGARQVIGYPGTPKAHYCCTVCDIDIDDINVTDPKEWPCKDIHHIRRFAQIWRDAATEADRTAIFQGLGWRWSPLFELEYWDPSLFTVIDSMHSLDLNLLQNHVRFLFGIDTKRIGSDAPRPPTSANLARRVYSKKEELLALRTCQALVYDNEPDLLYRLLQFDRKILFSFCLDYAIRGPGHQVVIGTRWVLSKNIALWRQSQSESVMKFLTRFPRLSETQEELQNAPEPQEEAEDEGEVELELGDQGREPLGAEQVHTSANDDDEPSEEATGPPNVRGIPNLVRRLILVGETGVDSKSLYQQTTVALLTHFCDVLGIGYEDVSKQGRSTQKTQLYNKLIDKITKSPDLRQRLKDAFPSERSKPKEKISASFLGRDVMEMIWSDMRKTRLPSWVTAAPMDWGTKRRGTLSADNWRVICCIHLPITLIRLFGREAGRKNELVMNFMDLVMAVRVATMRRVSISQVELYDTYIFRYTEDVKKLFPDYRLLPSHHSALHIGEMLRRFGPKHSHDSPHYERYINFFHRDLEGTFLRTSARHANLRYLLSENERVKELAKNMIERLEMVENERARGFRLIDMFRPGQSGEEEGLDDHEGGREDIDGEVESYDELSEPHYDLLCQLLRSSPSERNVEVSRTVTRLSALTVGNSVYAPFDSPQYRDSSLVFRHDGTQRAGVIDVIFQHKHTTSSQQTTNDYYLAVHAYEPVEQENDIYRDFGPAAGFTCKYAVHGKNKLVLISPIQIVSHVALTEFEDLGIVHILPLNREMLSAEQDEGSELLDRV